MIDTSAYLSVGDIVRQNDQIYQIVEVNDHPIDMFRRIVGASSMLTVGVPLDSEDKRPIILLVTQLARVSPLEILASAGDRQWV